VQLTDTLSGATTHVAVRMVVNAAGPWADAVNAGAGITAPFRHVLSRGVSLCLPRDPRHDAHLVFDTDDGNALTLAPWGPVALWASTESLHPDVETAGRIEPADVTYLLDHYNARFRTRVTVDDVVSLRVGVRPVPVTPGQRIDPRGLGLSRHHRLHLDSSRPWLTIFGGKLSGCHGVAREVRALVQERLAPAAAPSPTPSAPPPMRADSIPHITFPGMPTPLVAPQWSAGNEHCHTLEDYVRRRTTIAQWIPGGGFGRHDEHLTTMRALARALHHGDDAAATLDLERWRRKVDDERRVLDSAADRANVPSSGVLA
jgi:glycerol-3-phosphate dehydrogenase